MRDKINVLYVCHDYDHLYGASTSLLRMISALKNHIYPIVLIPGYGDVYDFCQQNGIECIVSPFFMMWEGAKKLKTALHHPTRSTLYRYLTQNKKCANQVSQIIGNRKIDIVHSNSSITTVGIELSKKLNSKHVWHIREFLDIDFHLNIYLGIPHLRRLINKADAQICISNAVKTHWHFTSKTVYVIYNAIKSKNEICFSQPKEKYFLFCAGNLGGTKHADEAIIAFAKSGMKNEGYCLKLIGEGSEETMKNLNQLIQDFELQNNIQFLGYQKDVKKHFVAATAFLMMSENEALGRVSLEAMFYGCPLIARNTGGTVDFAKHGENSYLFDNLDQCSDLMISCAKQLPISMIQASQKMVEDLFTEEVYKDKVLDVYHKVLECEQ